MTETVDRPELVSVDALDTEGNAVDEFTTQIQLGSERVADGWKAMGASVVDTYGQAVDAALELQAQLVEAALSGLSALAQAQQLAARQLQAVQVRLMRELVT